MTLYKNGKLFEMMLSAAMLIVAIVTVYPFLHVLALSLNDAMDAIGGGIYIWPREFTLRNYEEVMKYDGLVTGLSNSIVRTLIGTTVGVLLSAMLAFTLSRRDYFARKFINTLFVISMYVSGGLIPGYILIKEIGLYNNFLVYIVPQLVWAFVVFVIRSFIDSLPAALQESAMIDGANDFVIFFRIIFPLCMPVLATGALFYAVGHWNSWFDTYLYASREESLTTLQFELQKILRATQVNADSVTSGGMDGTRSQVTPQAIQMAVTIVATVPILIVYPFLQRYFVKGMTLGAVKS